MENQFQKIVNIGYVAFSALVSFLLLALMMKLSNTYDLESKVKSVEFIVRGLSIVMGAGVFFGLYMNSKANLFMNEVVSELLTKVTWPTGKDTVSATIIVIITVVIAGITLAIFDWLFTVSLRWFWDMTQRWFF